MLQIVGLILALTAAAQAPSGAALTNDTVVALLRRAPAFAPASGRTELAVVRKMVIPGTDDAGWFVEVSWIEKGKPRAAIVAVARTDVPGRSPEEWVVRQGRWGVAAVLEDKTWNDLVRELTEARTAGLQFSALTRVRMMVAAQNTFAHVTGGFAGDAQCLTAPASCGVKGVDIGFLDERYLAAESGEYRFTLHAGPPKRQAPSLFEAYAYTAVPTAAGAAAYCADSKGRLCARADGQAPRVQNGSCMDPCEPVQR